MSEAINTGGNAFPCDPFIASKPGNEASAKRIAEGMSLRDYFAAKAMQARISDYESCQSLARAADSRGVSFANELAAQSYDMADAMIRARDGSAP